MMLFMDPFGRALVGELGSRRHDVGRGLCPVGPVLVASAKKADESIVAPKGHGPRTTMAIADPLWQAPFAAGGARS
jgi:hypothetical protein